MFKFDAMKATKFSTFVKCGKISLEEFKKAGDTLVEESNMWKWESEDRSSSVNPHVADGKLFLNTSYIVKNGEFVGNSQEALVESSDSESDASPLDLEELEASGTLDNSVFVDEIDNFGLNITFCEDFMIPRLYVTKFKANNEHFNVKDIHRISPGLKKLPLYEDHPYSFIPMLTDHPCKHADMMKRLINQYVESGKEYRVQDYLFLFLAMMKPLMDDIDITNLGGWTVQGFDYSSYKNLSEQSNCQCTNINSQNHLKSQEAVVEHEEVVVEHFDATQKGNVTI